MAGVSLRSSTKVGPAPADDYVIDRVEHLFEAMRPGFAPPLYERLKGLPDIAPRDVLPTDVWVARHAH